MYLEYSELCKKRVIKSLNMGIYCIYYFKYWVLRQPFSVIFILVMSSIILIYGWFKLYIKGCFMLILAISETDQQVTNRCICSEHKCTQKLVFYAESAMYLYIPLSCTHTRQYITRKKILIYDAFPVCPNF